MIRNVPSRPVSSPSNLGSSLSSPPNLHIPDRIDDDFPYDAARIYIMTPNTRTCVRPGAMAALGLCDIFWARSTSTPAARKSHTDNVLRVLDKDGSPFERVIHRDDYPEIVECGNDLRLFDDGVSNFVPQNYENGVTIRPFTPEGVRACHGGSWGAYYLVELRELSRLMGNHLIVIDPPRWRCNEGR
ncbi:hypothetical protein ACHAXA_009580 [Cyclostephanos tholiformis]|uniref:Uncharacterized protein n=1 Tax=Cyclostephanos tholiformis TaxID=382380 RepID=A0ABD3SDV0_9STRA